MLLEDHSLLTYNDIGCKGAPSLSPCRAREPKLTSRAAAFGSGVRWIISFLFCIELFALAVALVVIFADSFHVLFPDPSLLAFKLLAFLVVLPTVFLPYRLLSYTSLIGLLSSLVLVVVVIVDGAIKEEGPGSLRHPEPTSWSPGRGWGLSAGLIMSGVSCLVLSLADAGLTTTQFSGHAVMPSLARDMRHPERFDSMVNIAYLLAGAMYAVIGITGYLMCAVFSPALILDDVLILDEEGSATA